VRVSIGLFFHGFEPTEYAAKQHKRRVEGRVFLPIRDEQIKVIRLLNQLHRLKHARQAHPAPLMTRAGGEVRYTQMLGAYESACAI